MSGAPEPLTAEHLLAGFDSGVASLGDGLRRRALRNQVSGASRTFVACDAGRVLYAMAVRDGDVFVVPEPGTYALMLAGLAALAMQRSRQRL